MWRGAKSRSQGEERRGTVAAGSGGGWERQATAWTLIYRFSVIGLLILAVAGARAAQGAAQRATTIAAENRATLATIQEEVDDLEHR